MSATSEPFRQELNTTFRLALPLVGGQLASVGMSFVDTVMAGRLGAKDLAAIAVGGAAWAAVMLFMTGVLMALPPVVAELRGARRGGEIASAAWQGAWIALALAVAIVALIGNLGWLLRLLDVEPEIVPTVVGYLRALRWGVPALALYFVLRFVNDGVGQTRPTLYFGVVGLPVNVFANYVLMYGHFGAPRLGAVGCGYATSIVWLVQCIGLALYTQRSAVFREIGLFHRLVPPRSRELADLWSVGLPIGVAIFMEASLFSVVAILIGSLGTEIVAGHQVALNFAALTFMVPLGISMAISVRVGFRLGERDLAGLHRAAKAGFFLVLGAQLISATLMVSIPRWIAGIYTRDPAVIGIAAELLLLAALFQLSDGVQVSVAGALRGLKDTRAVMIITVIAYWIVGLPVGWYLGFPADFGAHGMWVGLIAGLTAAAVLLSVRLRRRLRDLRASLA